MLIPTLLAFAMAGAQAQDAPQPNVVAPAIIQPRGNGPWGGVVPSDEAITQQLNTLVRQDPDRVICLRLVRGTSRLPREACRTLEGWYDFEAARDEKKSVRDVIAILKHQGRGGDEVGARLREPPYELVEMIKDRYQSPKIRARAVERAKIRRSSSERPPADPLVSHP